MDKIHKAGKTASLWWARPSCLALAWIKAHPFAVALTILFTALAFPFMARRESEWNIVYILAARHLRAGHGIYHVGEGYVYPPFMALLTVPFSYPPRAASLLAWYLVNVGAIVILARYAWKVASRFPSGGGESPESGTLGRLHLPIIVTLGLACGIRFISDALSHQQTDIVIGAILIFGGWLLVRSRSWLAAVSLGIAAGAKCTPLLFAVYLLWRRQWKQAGLLVAVAVGVNLLPNVFFPPADGSLHLVDWVETYLAPMTGSGKYPYSEQIYNQSLAGAVNRWFTTETEWTNDGISIIERETWIAPMVRKTGVYGIELLLLVATFGLFGRKSTPSLRTPWELSAILLLMVLLSPMSSKPHFCTLVLPGMCIARRMIETRDWWLGGLLTAAIVVGLLGGRGIVGKDLATLAMWHGHVMWSALILLAACGYGLIRAPRAPTSEITFAHPLMTPMGRIRATLRDRPARSTTSTTSSTFL